MDLVVQIVEGMTDVFMNVPTIVATEVRIESTTSFNPPVTYSIVWNNTDDEITVLENRKIVEIPEAEDGFRLLIDLIKRIPFVNWRNVPGNSSLLMLKKSIPEQFKIRLLEQLDIFERAGTVRRTTGVRTLGSRTLGRKPIKGAGSTLFPRKRANRKKSSKRQVSRKRTFKKRNLKTTRQKKVSRKKTSRKRN